MESAVTAAYDVSAEFYDVLQERRDHARARDRFGAAARRARTGVIDVGAGTGIVADVLVRATTAPVHAIEPADAMRAFLLDRLAGMAPRDRARVTVHPCPAQDFRLHRSADLAVAANVVQCLSPEDRRATWRALAEALVPGGLLLFDPPPESLERPGQWRLPPVHAGEDVYSAHVTSTPEDGVQRLHYTYRVHRAGTLVREEHEAFTVWPASRATVTAELEDAGFTPVRPPHRDVRAAVLRA
ncbi:class I SAM-dependent methyltransferase [Saccharothrix sp. NRRL B-16314]|uniref:class I SAM-dependent methyltransferase n=1 Tax=Saccharothrix sp. NRRL B-16314 TaxID=1463825 RepID=UPI000524D034|nr:class I SAM-dependent methyltransferase [Saccharothrix sp. NRRL B-16314]